MSLATLLTIFMALTFAQTNATKEKPSCQHDETTFRCVEYIKNYDGDTVTFNIPNTHPLLGKKISVRVLGVDTAEIKGKGKCEKESARTARRLIESKLKNAKNIELRNIKRDKYFRILADVYSDGESLAEILIKNRLAVQYYGKTKNKVDWCEMGRVPASSKKQGQ